MSYKLIAIDIDGTLLTDQYEIPPPTLKALNEAMGQAHIVLCTGRNLLSARSLLPHFSRPIPLITDNGATIWEPERGILQQASLSAEGTRLVLEYARAHPEIQVDFTTADGVYAERVKEGFWEMYERYNTEPRLVGDLLKEAGQPVKITLAGLSPEVMEEVYRQLEKELRQQQLEVQLFRTGPHFIDCMAQGANKGKALAHYARILGIPMRKTMAIGNYYNDVEMIRAAGRGVVVANAPPLLREMADEVTASNNEEGVRLILEKYVLQPKRGVRV